ncbi:hypothetical protein DRE_02129 [Drechslerella stenobrocha 248]|uniref:AB hydrolase-1 domain-containing protein n=1 Tax=Drechslerella stenobrocha 248 TaxID=1043628 RepID=W7IGN1_9PEZI|nr:hypothetical protein DRE_02129 [Drechslerella stenobrocha 248]
MADKLLLPAPYTTSRGVFRVEKHILPAFPVREHPRGLWHEDDRLQLVVNRYTPVSNPHPQPGDLTILLAHANGFHKELYEPFCEYLAQEYEKRGGRLRGIWIADMHCQGESGVLNETKLGGEVSWFDHTRDLLSVIQHFPNDIVRPIAGIGHSMGGAQLFRLSQIHPTLLSCVIGVDPVIAPEQAFPAQANPAQASAKRRDIWPSRDAAAAFFKSRPFYQRWDPEVLDLHLQAGLRGVPTAVYPDVSAVEGGSAAVTLTTTKHQEVFTFWRGSVADRRDPKDMFRWLGEMRVPVCYIQGEDSVINWGDNNELKMRDTPQPCEMHTVDAGHLVPQEKPKESATIAAEYLFRQIAAWKKETEQFKKEWAPRLVLGDDYFTAKSRGTKL